MDIEKLKQLKSDIDLEMMINDPEYDGPSKTKIIEWMQELLQAILGKPEVFVSVTNPRKCGNCDGNKTMFDGSKCIVCQGTGSPDLAPSNQVIIDWNDSD